MRAQVRIVWSSAKVNINPDLIAARSLEYISSQSIYFLFQLNSGEACDVEMIQDHLVNASLVSAEYTSDHRVNLALA